MYFLTLKHNKVLVTFFCAGIFTMDQGFCTGTTYLTEKQRRCGEGF